MTQGYEVTAVEAARKLGVALHYLYSLLWAGKLQGRKIGKEWRIPVEAVEARVKAVRVNDGGE